MVEKLLWLCLAVVRCTLMEARANSLRVRIHDSDLCMPHTLSPDSNNLLSALPVQDKVRWHSHLVPVELQSGQVLHETGCVVPYAYFPTTAIVSSIYPMENGATVEVAEVGREGFVGVSLVLGGDTAISRAVVRKQGYALRICGVHLRRQLDDSVVASHLFLRYIQAYIMHATQAAACARLHSLEQQFCSWLLSTLDRQHDNKIFITQEQIANLLGVRRKRVTLSALKIQDAGLISYTRGCIVVMDRTGLENQCCECYAVVKRGYDTVLAALQNAQV